MHDTSTKAERSARMWEDHPMSKEDEQLLTKAERTAERKARRLRLLAYIDKAKHVDRKSLAQIARKVGVSKQRVHELLAVIEGKGKLPAKKK